MKGESVPLESLEADSGRVVVEGILFRKDSRPIKNEKKLVTLLITDRKTSVCLKMFCSDAKWEEIDSLLKSGDYIKVSGDTEWDRYDNCLVIMQSSSGITKERYFCLTWRWTALARQQQNLLLMPMMKSRLIPSKRQ